MVTSHRNIKAITVVNPRNVALGINTIFNGQVTTNGPVTTNRPVTTQVILNENTFANIEQEAKSDQSNTDIPQLSFRKQRFLICSILAALLVMMTVSVVTYFVVVFGKEDANLYKLQKLLCMFAVLNSRV